MDFNGRPIGGGGGGDGEFDSVCADTVRATRYEQGDSCSAPANYVLPLDGPPTDTPQQLSVMTAATSLTNIIRVESTSTIEYVVFRGASPALAEVVLHPGDYYIDTDIIPLIEAELLRALYSLGGAGSFNLDLNAGKIRITASPGNNASRLDIRSINEDPTSMNAQLGGAAILVTVLIPSGSPYTYPNSPDYEVVAVPEMHWSPYFSAPAVIGNAIISGDGASSITALSSPANPSIVSQGNWGFGGATLNNVAAIDATVSASPFTLTYNTAAMSMNASTFGVNLGGLRRINADPSITYIQSPTGLSRVEVDDTENGRAIVSGNNGNTEMYLSNTMAELTHNGAPRFLVDATNTTAYSPNGGSYVRTSDGGFQAVASSLVRFGADSTYTRVYATDGITGMILSPNIINLGTSTINTYYGDNSSSYVTIASANTLLGAFGGGTSLEGKVSNSQKFYADSAQSYLATSTNRIGTNSSGGFTVGVLNAGDVIKAVAGSSAAPALTFATDATSGFYQPGSSTIGITVAGAEKARYTTTGLGIGTTTPNGILQLTSGSTPTAYIENSSVGNAAGPFAFMDVTAGGSFNIGRANRSGTAPTAAFNAATISATGAVDIPVDFTVRSRTVSSVLYSAWQNNFASGNTETNVVTGALITGSLTIPANSLWVKIGSILEFTAMGVFSLAVANTVRFRVRGTTGGTTGTVLFDSSPFGANTGGVVAFNLNIRIWVQDPNNVTGSGVCNFGGDKSASFVSFTSSFDSTVQNIMTLTAQFTNAGDAMTVRSSSIRFLG